MRGLLMMAQSSLTENLCGQCRICMDIKLNQISVFKNDLSLKIEQIADVEVAPDDGLPTSICLDCEVLLNKCYELRERVIFADNTFREGISFSKVVIEEYIVKEETSASCANDEAMEDGIYDSSFDHENDNHVEVMDVIERTDRTAMLNDPLSLEEPLIEARGGSNSAIDPLACMKVEPVGMDCDSGAGPSTSTAVGRRETALRFTDLVDIPNKNDMPNLKIRQPEQLVGEQMSPSGNVMFMDHSSNLPTTNYSPSVYDYKSKNDNLSLKTSKSSKKHLVKNTHVFQYETQFVINSSVINDHEKSSIAIVPPGQVTKDTTAGLQSVLPDTKKISIKLSVSEHASNTSDVTCEPTDKSKITSGTFCIVCNIDLEKEDRLREHREFDNGNFMCRVCTAQYTVHSKLEVHFFTHKSYKCPVCKLRFFTRKDLLNHRSSSACNVKVSCDLCPRSFFKIENLRLHKRSMHSQSHCYIACIVCLKTFKTVRQRSDHLKNCHIAYESLECRFCHRLYIGPDKLKSHLKLTHVECNIKEVDPCKCPFCDKVFTKKSNLRGHMLIHDKTVTLCELCGKSVKGKMPMYYHMREEHSQKGSFTCEICGELFDTEKKLKRHTYRRHTKRSFTPSVCEICGKSFKTSNTLKHHMQTHSDDRPYRCDICGAGFKVLTALRTHGRVHNNLGKYSCTFCGLSFKWKQTFDKHVLKCEANKRIEYQSAR